MAYAIHCILLRLNDIDEESTVLEEDTALGCADDYEDEAQARADYARVKKTEAATAEAFDQAQGANRRVISTNDFQLGIIMTALAALPVAKLTPAQNYEAGML